MFWDDDPEKELYDNVNSIFGFDEIILIGFESEDAFSDNTMSLLSLLTEKIENLNFVEKVISLSNVKEVVTQGETLQVRKLIETIPIDEENRERIRRKAYLSWQRCRKKNGISFLNCGKGSLYNSWKDIHGKACQTRSARYHILWAPLLLLLPAVFIKNLPFQSFLTTPGLFKQINTLLK